MIYGTITCLGDSLTFGARAALGYPEVLPELINPVSATEWSTLNRGISGQTTRQILDRAPGATRELDGLPGAKRMVILTGTNDSKAGGIMSVDEWEGLLRQLLAWPRRCGIPVVLCTHPPVDPVEMPAFTPRSQEWLLDASDRVRTLVTNLDCDPAPITLCELADMPEQFLCDGVHLYPSGYRWMAHRIARALGFEPTPPLPAPPGSGPRLPRRVVAVG